MNRLQKGGVGLAAWLMASVSPLALLGSQLGAGELAPEHGAASAASPVLVGMQLADSGSGETGESGEGGEGGEGGEAGVFNDQTPEDLFLLGHLTMMRGHIAAGSGLLGLGHAEGRDHLGHPYVENWGFIEAEIAARGLTSLEEPLHELGEAGESGEAQPLIDAALSAIDGNVNKITGFGAARAPLLLDASLLVLKQAAHEYEESIADGVFVNDEEYQDAAGFVAEVRRLIDSETPALTAIDGAATQALLEALEALAQAWPSLVPPASPAKTPAEVHAAVSKVELAMSPLRP